MGNFTKAQDFFTYLFIYLSLFCSSTVEAGSVAVDQAGRAEAHGSLLSLSTLLVIGDGICTQKKKKKNLIGPSLLVSPYPSPDFPFLVFS